MAGHAVTRYKMPGYLSSRSLAQVIVGIVAAGMVWWSLWATLRIPFVPAWFPDFATFYIAGSYIVGTTAYLYDPAAVETNPFNPLFKLPPPAALYLSPLGLLPAGRAFNVWRACLLVAYWATFFLLCWRFGGRFLSWPWLVGVVAWSLFSPAQSSISGGQWDALFLLLASAGAVAVQSSHPRFAALPMALAASVKLYPLLTALYFIGRRDWVTLSMTLAILVALLALGGIVVGPHESWIFLTHILPASGATTANLENQSLGGVIARLATSDLRLVPLRGASIPTAAIRLLAITLCATVIWWLHRSQANDGLDRALQFSLGVSVSILAIPVAWSHYLTVLLLPLLLLILRQAGQRRHCALSWLWIATAYILVALPDPTELIPHGGLILVSQWPLAASQAIMSYPFIGAALVAVLVGWNIRSSAIGSSSEESAEGHGPESQRSA